MQFWLTRLVTIASEATLWPGLTVPTWQQSLLQKVHIFCPLRLYSSEKPCLTWAKKQRRLMVCCTCRYKEGDLNVGENSCVDRCASKYWQVTGIVGQLLGGAQQ